MHIGQLRAMGLAKESVVGTLVTPPTRFLPIALPDSFFPNIQLLEDSGIRAIPDLVYKADQGPGTLNGMKAKFRLEPENAGEILMATFGVDTVTGSGAAGYTHTFLRLGAPQLPTYSIWLDKGIKFPQFTGCMMNKLDIIAKAKDYVWMDSDWTGLKYDDTGSSKSPAYSALAPLKFDQLVVNVDGSQVNNYDNVKISFDNMVKAEHALNGSIYPAKIYSEGFKVTVSMDFFAEDNAQFNKFLAGTTAALNFALTTTYDITGASGGIKNSLIIDIPTIKYSAAAFPLSQGILKVNFVAVAIYTVASTKTASAALKNSVSAAY